MLGVQGMCWEYRVCVGSTGYVLGSTGYVLGSTGYVLGSTVKPQLSEQLCSQNSVLCSDK